MLAIADSYYDDEYEWSDAINGMYRALMRAMRDTGIPGHVLIGDTMKDEELAALANQKVFFFLPDPDRESLASLLEHQRQVAVGKDQLKILFDLTGEYDLGKIFIVDPDREAIERVSPISILTRLPLGDIAGNPAMSTGMISRVLQYISGEWNKNTIRGWISPVISVSWNFPVNPRTIKMPWMIQIGSKIVIRSNELTGSKKPAQERPAS